MRSTTPTLFDWFAPAQPKKGEVLAGEIRQGDTVVGQIHIARSGALKPHWLIYVTTLGTRFPQPIIVPTYHRALEEGHAILRNGIAPGSYEQNSTFGAA